MSPLQDFFMWLGFIVITLTAIFSYLFNTRDIVRLGGLLADALSIMTLGFLAILGGIFMGQRLTELVAIPYIEHAPLAVFIVSAWRLGLVWTTTPANQKP